MNLGAIVDMFQEEPEEQAEVAAMFNTNLVDVTETSEREKALRDLVIAVKKNSMDVTAAKPDRTMEDMMKEIENRKAFEKLKKITFNLGE